MKGTQILMHKGEKVATCSFDSRGYLKSVSKIHNQKLLPLCVGENNPMLDLQRWILARNMATNRRDIAPLREFYGSAAFAPCTALSLFDCYWFANEEYKDWEAINAYDNWKAETDSLFLMISYPDELWKADNNSPNLTIPGRSERLWYRFDKDIYLLHGDTQAQKEMAEYKLANNNPIVMERNYTIVADKIYTMMKSETNKDVERISLEDMYNSCQDPEKSKMQNLQICCEKFGIPNWKNFFSAMCDFDEKIANTSRELCDIGVLRNSNTLETIGFAKL